MQVVVICSRRANLRSRRPSLLLDQPSLGGGANFFHWAITKQADHFRCNLLMSASLLSRTGVYQRFSLNGIRKIIELSTNKYARFPRYSSLSKLNAAANSFFKLSKSIEASFDANRSSCLYQNDRTRSGIEPWCGSAKHNRPPGFRMR